MITRKVIVAILSTFCLTAVLFLAVPVNSSGKYDPLIDFNYDGRINVLDLIKVSTTMGKLGTSLGTSGTPMNVTQTIIDLQNRVNALEEKGGQTKWIRLYDPNEYHSRTTDPLVEKEIVTFYWGPDNATNNAVVSIRCYFQYYTNGTEMNHPVSFTLILDGREGNPLATEGASNETTWSRIYTDSEIAVARSWPYLPQSFIPNIGNHTITFRLNAISYDVTACVKDINILLEVVDGLPPS